MAPLSSDLRKLLEKSIVKARQSAEAGAKNALEMLAVDRHEPHTSMSPEERALRNRLRARGRQLGDVRDKARGTQSIDRLVQEVAYEYWHRMLFARFLSENNLLIEPNSGIAISMEECEELAREAGEDSRSMAARFAQDSLPQIFRSGDPVLEVALAPEIRQALDKLLDGLPATVFTADDSLGWTYQFWQTEKKKAVNEAGNKVGADELPAVTQLFTEHYMVLFLFHNTIGAWHAGKVLAENPGLAETAQNEDELRKAVRLQSGGGYEFEYLRFVREANDGDAEDTPTGTWRPAAGTFDGWPSSAMELKVLDPCCGSGHFLTEGFELLVRLRMDEEGFDVEDAIHGVLTDNLHGLELDSRCTQIAAFNLALTAWKLAGKANELPPLHIACTGLTVGSTKAEWTRLAGNSDRARNGMSRLFHLFEQAPELGSLIDPKALKGDMFEADFSALQPLLEQALERESHDVEIAERTVTAQGMARAAELLSGQYTLVITNVPYLTRGSQSSVVRGWADDNAKAARACLSTMFIERCFRFGSIGLSTAVVSPRLWLFLKSYRPFRESSLKSKSWNLLSSLGTGAFETISGEVVNVALIIFSNKNDLTAGTSIDVSSHDNPATKSLALRVNALKRFDSKAQLANPECRVVLDELKKGEPLSKFAACMHGQGCFDNASFVRKYWEISKFGDKWILQQSSSNSDIPISGFSNAFLWEDGVGRLSQLMDGKAAEGYSSGKWRAGIPAWKKQGVAVSGIGKINTNRYSGESFDENVTVICPFDQKDIDAIWTYCTSNLFVENVRVIDQKPHVTPNTYGLIPFDREHWQKSAAMKYPNGLPDPQSNDPTQWLFHGHPAKAELPTVLQVAVGRLLGYRWPSELAPDMRLADESRKWVARCDTLKKHADEDGIVCLSALRGESSAADRLRELLSSAFASDWSTTKERELLTVAGDGKKPCSLLEIWLRDKFFEEHCRLFHHRPFVWHIWDGNKQGFHCLVNAHKLTGPSGGGRRTLESITYSYLGDWIERQKADQTEGKEGADARLAAAQDLQGQLVKILEGEPPFDLFVRWKPLHEQAIGWDPDINDGARLNVRPFMKAELGKGGKKGAGVLRWKPNIKWGPTADRGNDPQSIRPKADFPWFWGCNDGAADFAGGKGFDGNRWNDLHYSNAFKQAARERADERKK